MLHNINWRLDKQRASYYVAICLLYNRKICYIAHPNLPDWIHVWIHASEFVIMKSYMNSYFEFIYEQLIQNAELKSYNVTVTHSGLQVGLWLWRVPWLKLLDWTWTGQAQPAAARLPVCQLVPIASDLEASLEPQQCVLIFCLPALVCPTVQVGPASFKH